MDDRIAISFPNMGINNLEISRIAFRVFNNPIYWYGIIIALAFLVCVLWAMKDSPKFDLVPETVIDLMLFAGPGAIICARIYYVVFSWGTYKSDLKEIFNIRNGGLAVLGGVIGGIIIGYFVARNKKIPTFKFFDFFIPYVALGQAIGRWGNFFNQEAFGTNTSLPWGMTSPVTKAYLASNAQQLHDLNGITVYPDLPVHPTFLYESILCFGIFVLLLWMRKKKRFDGEVFCLYFVTYCLGRAFIEGLRTDSLMIGTLRVSQLLSIILVIVFGIFIIYKRLKIKNGSAIETEVGTSGYADILKIMEEEERLEAAQQLNNQPEMEHVEVYKSDNHVTDENNKDNELEENNKENELEENNKNSDVEENIKNSNMEEKNEDK
jgi:phosphatidylglycerol---prolipoprotein diacylglyceryl transferase